MQRQAETSHAWILLSALALAGWIYRDTYVSVVETWRTNSTFSHGFLILPISLWLAWRNRRGLMGVVPKTSWLGTVAVIGCVAAWVVGRGAGVLGFEQAAVIALIPALLLAACGFEVVRVMAMPIAYLAFAVPVGHALVPWLMHATADLSSWLLKLTFVPVHRSEMYIQIPGGRFEVARACSGLNYVVTGVALGALYSYLTYAGWRKRLVSMAAFVVVPVVANGLRVYFTILISFLTDMRFGPGAEHVWFGRVFFILVMFVMFLVGRRWSDDVRPAVAASENPRRVSSPGAQWLAVASTCAAVIAGPPYLASALEAVERQLAHADEDLVLPAGAAPWRGPAADADAWRPLYSGARVQESGRYTDAEGRPVDVYVAVYGLGASSGSEMISYQNRIFDDERRVLKRDHVREVGVPGGGMLSVRELDVADSGHLHRVWYWYMVGDRVITSPYQVKVQEALAFLARRAVTERIVTLATPVDASEDGRLATFIRDHSRCVAVGFAARGCAP